MDAVNSEPLELIRALARREDARSGSDVSSLSRSSKTALPSRDTPAAQNFDAESTPGVHHRGRLGSWAGPSLLHKAEGRSSGTPDHEEDILARGSDTLGLLTLPVVEPKAWRAQYVRGSPEHIAR